MPRIKRYVVGSPMASGQMDDQLLPIPLALPIFSADAISSVAYATEAAMVVLVGVSLGALHWTLPIAIAVSALMAIVVASYRQTVRAYDQSGGAYIVAKENLGKLPSLVAAAALLVDYILTVAVSVASGIFAITSAVAVARAVPRRAVARGDRADRHREPPRRPGSRDPLRDPDVRVHPRALRSDRHGPRPLRDR